jgi:pimeloyl-ACP methyl ester carboxylesterase
MTAVFVHGVPDTPRVWEPLLDRLDRDDVVAVRLPGFGCERPEGFAATKEAYAEWLRAELAGLEGPIDLVGHDWGCMLTLRVTSLGVDGLRSWAAGNGPIDPTYTWHDTAQLWQTPEVGEQVMRDLLIPDLLVPTFEAEGMSPGHAASSAADVDDVMKGCILDLYRSAVHVGDEWSEDLTDIAVPGLVLWAQRDLYVPPIFGERLAERTGARLVPLDSTHWWPVQCVDQVADELTDFWAGLDA